MKTPIRLLLIALMFFSFSSFAQNEGLEKETPPEDNLSTLKKIKGDEQYLYKYELYNKIRQILPFGWQISERQSNMIIFRDSVAILEETPPYADKVEDLENYVLRVAPRKTFSIVISFESYPEDLFINSKGNNDEVVATIEQLREKYKLNEMEFDEETSMPIAYTKAEKNNLAKFWIEKEILQTQVKPIPQYYVHDYGVNIEYPFYYAVYPSGVEVQAGQIYAQIKSMLTPE